MKLWLFLGLACYLICFSKIFVIEVRAFTTATVKLAPFLLAPSREPVQLSVCPQAVGGKAMEIPKGVATALDPPAVHLVVKRTVKGNVI